MSEAIYSLITLFLVLWFVEGLPSKDTIIDVIKAIRGCARTKPKHEPSSESQSGNQRDV